jgi:hypothetical protein
MREVLAPDMVPGSFAKSRAILSGKPIPFSIDAFLAAGTPDPLCGSAAVEVLPRWPFTRLQ